MKIEVLRKLAGREEIDYQFLMSVLSHYASPRDKITRWLKSGDIIRVKKGLYVFGPSIAMEPYSLEVLANLIYGPSAISFTYALGYYGLIPEKVSVITSVTNQRVKKFSTPVGEFHYAYLSTKKYEIGLVLQNMGTSHAFLISTPEKALCDQIYLVDKKIVLKDSATISDYLFHDLRIDPEVFYQLNSEQMCELVKTYQDPRLKKLYEFLRAGD